MDYFLFSFILIILLIFLNSFIIHLLIYSGTDNVVGVDLCLRNKDAIAFVMPYMPHDRFHDYFDKMNVKELQEYMENILIALKRVHEFGVIHRDVKPSNFLHDRKNHKFLLVDFGLAQALDKESESTKSLKNTYKETPSDKANNKPNEENTQCDNKNEQSTPTSQPNHALDCSAEHNESAEISADNCVEMTDATSYKRKLSGCDETENKCSSTVDSNPAKRQRTQSDDQTAAVQSNENTSQHPRGPYIPSSQFKTPLKQMNEISTNQKQLKRGATEFQSALSTDIKSTVLTYSIGTKIENQRNSMSPALKVSPAQMVISSKMPFSKNVTASEHILNTPTPPTIGRKYNLDNRTNGRNVKCFCYGRPTVCNICLVKKEIQATRAGTPGYRPTEVLLKYANQTTAVDCWAAGMFSIQRRFYFFFSSLINSTSNYYFFY